MVSCFLFNLIVFLLFLQGLQTCLVAMLSRYHKIFMPTFLQLLLWFLISYKAKECLKSLTLNSEYLSHGSYYKALLTII